MGLSRLLVSRDNVCGVGVAHGGISGYCGLASPPSGSCSQRLQQFYATQADHEAQVVTVDENGRFSVGDREYTLQQRPLDPTQGLPTATQKCIHSRDAISRPKPLLQCILQKRDTNHNTCS